MNHLAVKKPETKPTHAPRIEIVTRPIRKAIAKTEELDLSNLVTPNSSKVLNTKQPIKAPVEHKST